MDMVIVDFLIRDFFILDLFVVLGGLFGVYEDDFYLFFKVEIEFICW